ncbi:FecR family protein [Sphingobacterium siyangense]|uniref:FecR family protein n=1 Tax=Sphingobacterium siyangense TaxID=459529 RepID=UPI003DA68221
MDNNKAEKLLERYNKGKCTIEEKKLVEDWYLHMLNKNEHITASSELYKVKAKLDSRLFYQRKSRVFYRYAAAILAFATFTGILYYSRDLLQKAPNQKIDNKEIAAGGNKAILILADGKQFDLGSSKIGTITQLSGIKVDCDTVGQITFNVQDRSLKSFSEKMNSIVTPKGGQYKIILEDGTNIWLNAQSMLKFPERFAKDNRSVELVGEAYFEVAKNRNKPFIVRTKEQNVKVLGTHFNISSYADERIARTTLIEGSVSVSDNISHRSVVLKPGEQILISGNSIAVKKVDTQVDVAWKEGDFIFKNENIESIMRKVSRWYQVDVDFISKKEDITFSGMISKSNNLSAILTMLESTGQIKFKLTGRRISIIM